MTSRGTRWLALPSLLSAFLAPPSRAADCDVQFTFQVERPNRRPATGVQLHVEAGGDKGVRRATDEVKDSGSALICMPGARSGEMVDVRVTPATFRVLYPPRARLPLSDQGSPDVVVCEVGQDCALLLSEDVTRLIQKARPRAQGMSADEKAAFFREWLAYARDVSQETRDDNEKLFSALVRKERQVMASSKASTLLHTFVNRARELLLRFERHAERALSYRTPEPFQQMNEARRAYNPVFDEVSEHSDSYRKETADYWAVGVSGEFQALTDRALEIHRQDIYPLNQALTLINDCIRRQPSCPGKEAARAQVQQAVRHVREVTAPKVDRLDQDVKAWLQSLDDRLFAEIPNPS